MRRVRGRRVSTKPKGLPAQLNSVLSPMKISLTDIDELRQEFNETTGNHEISGQIYDDHKIIARYSVSWNERSSNPDMVFDIIFGVPSQLPPGEKCLVISILRSRSGSMSVVDSSSRPFARTMKSYGTLYGPDNPSDVLLDSAASTANYILKHDSRLSMYSNNRVPDTR